LEPQSKSVWCIHIKDERGLYDTVPKFYFYPTEAATATAPLDPNTLYQLREDAGMLRVCPVDGLPRPEE
jgi:hypothetical protein